MRRASAVRPGPHRASGSRTHRRRHKRQRAESATIVRASGSDDVTQPLRTPKVQVVGEVDGATENLRPGSFAEVTVPIGTSEQALAIPETAIRPTERGFLAFVVDGDSAHARVLTLGLRTPDGSVEVKSGLASGEQLVVRGGEALKDGVKVRISDGRGVATSSSAAPRGSAP